jgi:hypothetical protein
VYAADVSGDLSNEPAQPGMELDLAAAEARADRVDTQAMLDALAARLEGALPRMTAVKRRRVGGFRSKRTEVERIDVELGDARFELVAAGDVLRCARNKVVRGITLKHEEVPIERWIRDLLDELGSVAAVGEQTRIALEGLVL